LEFILNAYEYLSSGGIIIFPIIICSFLMWWLIIERIFYFRNMSKNDVNLHQAIIMLRAGHEPTTEQDYRPGLCAGVVLEFLNKRTMNKKLDQGILYLCVMQKRHNITKYIRMIAVLAAIAPLLGLLGTVSGMITTFDVISLFGTGNAKAMAGGISEAMITTQSGLVAAIPGLLMSGFLSRRATFMENRLDELILLMNRNL